MNIFQSGYLSIYLGPMRAAKTCKATNKATKYADNGERVLYINSTADRRNIEGGCLSKFTSHSSSNIFLSEKVTTITITKLEEVNADEFSVIVVDEAQFYEDLVECVIRWVDILNKYVIVVGLDSSYKRGRIGNILDLIPHADKYKKLVAICMMCVEELKGYPVKIRHNKAPFTLRKDRLEISDGDVIKPGDNDMYVPVCRYHYNKNNI